jgi:hypothetical protein
MVPLRGFVEGDSMGLLVFAHQDMPLSEVIRRLLISASVRVDVGDDAGWELRSNGVALPGATTVAAAGLTALDRVDLRRAAMAAQP